MRLLFFFFILPSALAQFNVNPTSSSYGYYPKERNSQRSQGIDVNPYAALSYGNNGQQFRNGESDGVGGSFAGSANLEAQNQYGRYGNINNATQLSYNNGGVSIQFQLRGFSNPSAALPGDNTCTCPPGQTCAFLKTSPRCFVQFVFVISSPDESVRYLATKYTYLDVNGQLPQNSQENWNEQFVVKLPSKPAAINVFALNLGPVITQTGQLVSDETVTHFDTFVVPLKDTIPAIDGVQNMNQQRSYQGQVLGTSLSISYSVSCAGNLVGPNCDLACHPSTINNNVAACRSNTTGFFSICRFVTGGQVDNCENCPWGIKEQTYCQNDQGSVLDPDTASVVDRGYKTWTIILGIVLLLLLIACCIFAIFTIFRSRRRPADKEMKRMNGDDRQPLQASYRAEGPVIQPRTAMMPPPPDARPIKSALRKPSYSPLNDTRDSSLASDLTPTRQQSRSEIV